MLLPIIEKPLGCVIYDGPSLLDHEPIVVIVTGLSNKSDNPKTGEMVQCWIIRKDMKPTDALTSGEDYSVCGDCIHRKAKTCYVNVFHAPLSIYKAYKSKRYIPYLKDNYKMLTGKRVRIGAYGDPASVPVKVWEQVCSVANGTTAYSHQWKSCDQELRKYAMASCDSLEQADKAKAMGWKTFRVLSDREQPVAREFVCPASEEAGKRLTCAECMACKGGEFTGQGTPVIRAHGVKAKRWSMIRERQWQKKGWQDLVPSYAGK